MTETPSPTPHPNRPAQASHPSFPWWLAVLTVLFVLVPFLFWRGTWFGRVLTDSDIEQYLAADDKPRKIQHALSQIADRMVGGDPRVRRWYPQVVRLSQHPMLEIRVTVAWVMGQDNQSEEFHQGLQHLLQDPEPMVRRNAALSLVRFGDASGRLELRAMLRPFSVRAPQDGRVQLRLKEADTVNPGTLLARLQTDEGESLEVRSPVPGEVRSRLLPADGAVQEGDLLYQIAPGEEQVWEALRGLYLVGQPDDLPVIEPYTLGIPGVPERVRQQAILTRDAIAGRGLDPGSRGEPVAPAAPTPSRPL